MRSEELNSQKKTLYCTRSTAGTGAFNGAAVSLVYVFSFAISAHAQSVRCRGEACGNTEMTVRRRPRPFNAADGDMLTLAFAPGDPVDRGNGAVPAQRGGWSNPACRRGRMNLSLSCIRLPTKHAKAKVASVAEGDRAVHWFRQLDADGVTGVAWRWCAAMVPDADEVTQGD
jgi:hypothetical protein